MVGNRLEKEIIGVFNRDISAFMSINQISKKLKRSYPHVNHKVKKLIQEGVLKKSQVGRSHLCFVNFTNEKAVALLTLDGIEKRENYLSRLKGYKQLLGDINTIRREFKVHTILLCRNKLIFVLDYLYDMEAIKNLFSSLADYELMFFDRKGFKCFVLENKQFINHSVVLYSFERFYELLGEIEDSLMLSGIRPGRGRNAR